MSWERRRSLERGRFTQGKIECFLSLEYRDFKPVRYPTFYDLRGLYDNHLPSGEGFDWHPHDNVEILALPIRGQLHHQDTLGNDTFASVGEAIYTSSGSGLKHREFAANTPEDLRFINLWISPARSDATPFCEKRSITSETPAKSAKILILGSSSDAVFSANISSELSLISLGIGERFSHCPSGPVWIQIISGRAAHENGPLDEGDSLFSEVPTSIDLTAASRDLSFLIFEQASLTR